MYSKNDYRYYLENRLVRSDDFLAHYGVKGMKWKNHKRDVTFEKWTDSYDGEKNYRIDFNKHDGGHRGGGWSDGIGVRYNPGNKNRGKSLTFYDTTKTKWDKKNDDYVYEKKTKGRITKERAEDGVSYTIDLSKRKKKLNGLRKKYGLNNKQSHRGNATNSIATGFVRGLGITKRTRG